VAGRKYEYLRLGIKCSSCVHTHLWIVGSGNGGIGGGGGDGGGGDRGIDKGPERTSYGSGGGGEGGGSGSYGGGRPQPRARRTQRRVTHNEKRYHSGSAMHYVASERTNVLPSCGKRDVD